MRAREGLPNGVVAVSSTTWIDDQHCSDGGPGTGEEE
jgi:hypothetical protein